ncbi:MAG: S9 family peptidase [Armatimonadetes bacterium]|nr:S9 family peptidase [Armatimonadota bacterium]
MSGKRKQKITPRALMELKMPGEVQVAPDSRRVAYSVSETDWDGNRVAQHLYVAVVSEEDTPPRQVTRGRSEESEPRWSPDGKWLAFLAAREDEEADDDDYEDEEEAPKSQVWLLPMDGLGGEAERLTEAPEGVGAYDWLPDSSGVVYLAREPRPAPLQHAREDRLDRKDDAVVEREEKFRQQIWRIGVEDKKAKLAHPGDFGIGELAVSPDGRLVAFTTNYTGEENDYHKADVWTLDLATGQTRQLTDGPGGKFHPVWTPDGQAILFIRPLNPEFSYSQENLFCVALSDKSIVSLTDDFPHDLTGWHTVWFDAQGALYVTAAVGTTTGIYRRPPEGGAFQAAVQNDEHVHEFHVARSGGLAYVASSATDVPELLWLAPGASESVPLTDLNDDWYEKYRLAETELVSWPSPDGLTIEALLTLPPGYDEGQTYPLIVSLHGGPHGRTVQALSPFTTSHVWAAEGYAVLSPNYRGSEGYGEAFGTASRADLGGGDYEDVMAGVDWAVAEGVADPDRLGVIGSSYGGYLVNWIVTKTTRFKAAVSQFGIFSLVTDFSNSQAPRWDLEYLGGHPWEMPDLYVRHSPASSVQSVRTPVLIMHGDHDPNTFIANSQEMYQALRLQDKTVEFVHYPREGHGFYEPQHRLDEMRRILSWWEKYVRGGGQPATYRVGDRIAQNGWQLTVTGAALATYAGRADDGRRYVEVTFVLRDADETRASLTLGPSDVTLTRGVSALSRNGRPVGLPVDVLGQKVLAEGQGWKFVFTPGKDERGLAVPVALTFRVTATGGTYALAIKDFPPVTIDVPAAEDEDRKKAGAMRKEA